MKLTEYQQAMLDGAHGKGKEMAMRILVGIGKCFYADRLVPVTRAHVSLSAQEADTWFAKKLFDAAREGDGQNAGDDADDGKDHARLDAAQRRTQQTRDARNDAACDYRARRGEASCHRAVVMHAGTGEGEDADCEHGTYRRQDQRDDFLFHSEGSIRNHIGRKNRSP